MNQNELPLFELFNQLRLRGLVLGIDDYIPLIKALQSGFAVQDKKSLKRLCITLWAKSKSDVDLIELFFKRTFENWSNSALSQDFSDDREADGRISTDSAVPKQPIELSHAALPTAQLIEATTPMQAIQIARPLPPAYQDEIQRPRQIGFDEYFPVTRRQMKQSWRYLRRMVREGMLEELDIDATIKKFASTGVLAELVFVPLRLNHAELVLIIDQDGSMVPFHALSRRLVETASRGGRLKDANIYFFHDYPEDYLYTDAGRLHGYSTEKIVNGIGERTYTLIVSDAGAARGGIDPERLRKTANFLAKIQKNVRRVAWINPMPRKRWINTTANDIAAYIPMFEMSRRGLDSAISFLRGRYFSSNDNES